MPTVRPKIFLAHVIIAAFLCLIFAVAMKAGHVIPAAEYEPDAIGLRPGAGAVGWRQLDQFSRQIVFVTLICGMVSFLGTRQRIAAGMDRGGELRGLLTLGLIFAAVSALTWIVGLAIVKATGVQLGALAVDSDSPVAALIIQFLSGLGAFLAGLCITSAISTYGGRGVLYLILLVIATLTVSVIIAIAVSLASGSEADGEWAANWVALVAGLGFEYSFLRRLFNNLNIAT
ncbi:MAG: hypothetical protein Q4P33_02565 [Flaviflexus sp.]|nr:hypothetical protein [Flaviflexus sp.]